MWGFNTRCNDHVICATAVAQLSTYALFILSALFLSVLFMEPSCSERDIVWCMRVFWVHCACVHLSGFVRAITYTFVHGFKNNLAQLLSQGVEVPSETFVQVG